jgi:hypothetical protein
LFLMDESTIKFKKNIICSTKFFETISEELLFYVLNLS